MEVINDIKNYVQSKKAQVANTARAVAVTGSIVAGTLGSYKLSEYAGNTPVMKDTGRVIENHRINYAEQGLKLVGSTNPDKHAAILASGIIALTVGHRIRRIGEQMLERRAA